MIYRDNIALNSASPLLSCRGFCPKSFCEADICFAMKKKKRYIDVYIRFKMKMDEMIGCRFWFSLDGKMMSVSALSLLLQGWHARAPDCTQRLQG